MSEINVTKISSKAANTPPTIVDSGDVEVGQFCRAWVNFNGTGTVAIRGSFNVSSITDNGTGDYTVNFTNAMNDTNFVVTTSSNYATSTSINVLGETITNPTRTVSSVRLESAFVTSATSRTLNDIAVNSVSIFAN